MGKGSPSLPPAPDPNATAAAQAAANKEAAVASQQLNMINQYTPYGSLEYTRRGSAEDGTPQYSATQSLSPSQQALFNLQNDAMIRYGQVANNQLNNVATRLSSPLTLLGQSGTTGDAGGSYGATRFRSEDVPTPDFVPPTAADGVGGTRTIYEAAPGTRTEVVTPGTSSYETVWDPNAGPGGSYVDKLVTTPDVTREVPNPELPVEQTYTAEGWINTANLPEGWSAQPTPEQIEQARIQWLIDNPPSTRQVSQTYTENGWVDTSTLPEGWTPPTGTAGTTGTTNPDGMFSLGADGMPGSPVANEETRQNVANALYERLNPQFDRDRAALETRLANQGIQYGSQAYNAAMDDFNRGLNDARLGVENAALGQMSQLYGLEANARDRAVNEMVMQRNQPLNELAAMLTGSQVQNPNFINTPQTGINPADIAGLTYGNYNANLNAYNAQQQNAQANRQGLFGLLGTAAQAGAYAWSDRRLKRDITQVGFLPNGLPVYMYKYNWDDEWHMGLMADEVREVNPDAVVTTLSGFDAVNYAEAVR